MYGKTSLMIIMNGLSIWENYQKKLISMVRNLILQNLKLLNHFKEYVKKYKNIQL